MGPGNVGARFTVVLPLIVWCFMAASVQSVNITAILEDYQFNIFNQLLTETGVAKEINGVGNARGSMTLLVLDDIILNSFTSRNQNALPNKVADLLRYHVLMHFFMNAPTEDTSVGTLLQITGDASYNGTRGLVNIYKTNRGVLVGPSVGGGKAQVVDQLLSITWSGGGLSIFKISKILMPEGFNLNGPDRAGARASIGLSQISISALLLLVCSVYLAV